MWEAIPDGHIFDLCRVPSPPVSHTRAYTRVTFFASFFGVTKKGPLAPKREPWRPANLQKNNKNEGREGVRKQLQK